ncbi:M24 family metallopeptidase [Micromonospora olivasterospora]|uniref:Xaa-Pro dipeptidase n=1 Tax=Micromonospora olivasterospora TaxID=1880 RepID=A0A562II94_MICOL|nr:Xaa-Pro peptidase family protein [Micromonospora olivasterospora]TWH70739.1 Xaa-Pro dipeptidase [Micromonospora olivasterospora]
MNRYFTDDEYASRLAAVRADMAARNMDALLVTGPENITYLTGYTTPGYHIFQCVILPAEGDITFVVRNTERVNVPDLPWVAEPVPIGVESLSDPIPVLLSSIRREGLAGKRLGVDRRSLFLPPLYYDQLREEIDLVDASGLVERHRARKSPAEIALIQRATELAEASVLAGLDSLRTARTDSDVAATVLASLARGGSEYTGSPAYIVPGVSSLVTHSTHAQRPVGDQEPLRLEVCASKGRYHGVLTRTVTRARPTSQLTGMVALSAAAGEAMRAAARPGVPIGDVDRAGRSLVEAEVPAAYWPNRGGYSMGIAYPPGLGEGDVLDIRAGDPRPVEVGMVFHLLPTLRVPGLGAVGCTDILAVEENGTRFLSTLPRTVLSATE